MDANGNILPKQPAPASLVQGVHILLHHAYYVVRHSDISTNIPSLQQWLPDAQNKLIRDIIQTDSGDPSNVFKRRTATIELAPIEPNPAFLDVTSSGDATKKAYEDYPIRVTSKSPNSQPKAFFSRTLQKCLDLNRKTSVYGKRAPQLRTRKDNNSTAYADDDVLPLEPTPGKFMFMSSDWNMVSDDIKASSIISGSPDYANDPFTEQTSFGVFINPKAFDNIEHDLLVRYFSDKRLDILESDDPDWSNTITSMMGKKFPSKLSSFIPLVQNELSVRSLPNETIIRKVFFAEIIGFASPEDYRQGKLDLSRKAAFISKLGPSLESGKTQPRRCMGWSFLQYRSMPSVFDPFDIPSYPITTPSFETVSIPKIPAPIPLNDAGNPKLTFVFSTSSAVAYVMSRSNDASNYNAPISLAARNAKLQQKKCIALTRLPLNTWSETSIMVPENISIGVPLPRQTRLLGAGSFGTASEMPFRIPFSVSMIFSNRPNPLLHATIHSLERTMAIFKSCLWTDKQSKTRVAKKFYDSLRKHIPLRSITISMLRRVDKTCVAQSICEMDVNMETPEKILLKSQLCQFLLNIVTGNGMSSEQWHSMLLPKDAVSKLSADILSSFGLVLKPVLVSSPLSNKSSSTWMLMVGHLLSIGEIVADISFDCDIACVSKIADFSRLMQREAQTSIYLNCGIYQTGALDEYYNEANTVVPIESTSPLYRQTVAQAVAQGGQKANLIQCSRNSSNIISTRPSVAPYNPNVRYSVSQSPVKLDSLVITLYDPTIRSSDRGMIQGLGRGIGRMQMLSPPFKAETMKQVSESNVDIPVPKSSARGILPCFGLDEVNSVDVIINPLQANGDMRDYYLKTSRRFWMMAEGDKSLQRRDFAKLAKPEGVAREILTPPSPVTDASIVDVISQFARVTEAVHYMNHEAGITHCDLKPTNFFINESHEAVIGDLGAAQPYGSSSFLVATEEYSVNLAGVAKNVAPYYLDSFFDTYAIAVSMKNAPFLINCSPDLTVKSPLWSRYALMGSSLTPEEVTKVALRHGMSREDVLRYVVEDEGSPNDRRPISPEMARWAMKAMQSVALYITTNTNAFNKPRGPLVQPLRGASLQAQEKLFTRQLTSYDAEFFYKIPGVLDSDESIYPYGYFDVLKVAHVAMTFILKVLRQDQQETVPR